MLGSLNLLVAATDCALRVTQASHSGQLCIPGVLQLPALGNLCRSDYEPGRINSKRRKEDDELAMWKRYAQVFAKCNDASSRSINLP